MALVTRDKTIKKGFIVCDKCKKEAPYQKTLSDTLELMVKHKWMPVTGTTDGFLCADCVTAILTDWYNKNKPESINMPLFGSKPDVFDRINIANMPDEVIDSLLMESNSGVWNNDDIPF